MGLAASVIVPTHTRADCLKMALGGLAAQSLPADAFEILVIGNNSPDAVREMVAQFAAAHPEHRVEHLNEAEQGINHARNLGLARAQGRVVCFVDDDVVADPGWLTIMLDRLSRPGAGGAGGPLLPDYQGRARPDWLCGDLQGLVGGYQLRYTEPTRLSRVEELPWGGNMGFTREALKRVGAFRTDLGLAGRRMLGGGDTDLFERVHRAGLEVWYLPAARARHLIQADRLEKPYLYKMGRALAATHIARTASTQPLQIARWFASDTWYAARLGAKYLYARAARKKLWFDDYMRFWIVAQRLPARYRALRSQW